MTSPVRVKKDNMQIRMIKRGVVITPVPDDDVGFFFGLR
jgi:hypothetical protein